MNDGERHSPPEICSDALKLQVLAACVLNEGVRSSATDMFDLVGDLEAQVSEMIERLEKIQQILARFAEFRPDNDGLDVLRKGCTNPYVGFLFRCASDAFNKKGRAVMPRRACYAPSSSVAPDADVRTEKLSAMCTAV